MNMKLVLAALAASVAAFLLGWGIYGIALHSYSEASMNKIDGFMKAEEHWSWLSLIAANVAYGCLLAYVMLRYIEVWENLHTAIFVSYALLVLASLFTITHRSKPPASSE